MIPDIVSKLTDELAEPIRSERQVVYILVEMRKLLESQGKLQNYQSLKLCCDWVVHPKLSFGPAQIVASYFDSYEQEFRARGISVKEYNFSPLFDVLTHGRFRAELIHTCTENGIHADRFTDDADWRNFLKYYMSVIQDCPLHAKAAQSKYVEHVSASAWPSHISEQIFPDRLVMEWTWAMKDGSLPHSVMAFF